MTDTGRAVAWRPAASRAALQQRARALAQIRQFFATLAVLEVATPVMVRAAVTDLHLASARVVLPGDEANARFLHTSPEYAMKRLLASGSGDIYQICQVVRGFERGRLHNSEFTLLEWYRQGATLEQLMEEVHALVELVAGRGLPVERLTYAQAFERLLSLDPLEATLETLRGRAVDGERAGELQDDVGAVNDEILRRPAGLESHFLQVRSGSPVGDEDLTGIDSFKEFVHCHQIYFIKFFAIGSAVRLGIRWAMCSNGSLMCGKLVASMN